MRRGSRSAFNEIYDRFWHKLFLVAVKKAKSADDAKDIVQDLFCSLWMKRDSLIIKVSLSSYLFTALKYKVINHIEFNVVKGHYLKSLNTALLDFDNSTDDAIIKRDLEQCLDAGIDRLSPKVKEVFELSRKEDLTINQIAEKLQLSEQTVKNQISKALKILRLHLSDFSAILPFILSFLVS